MSVFSRFLVQRMAAGGEVGDPYAGYSPEQRAQLEAMPEDERRTLMALTGPGSIPWKSIGQTLGIVGQDYKQYELDPRLGQVDYGQSNQIRDQQAALIQALQNQAAGKGQSLAQMQLQQNTDAGLKRAMALGTAQQGQGLGYQAALRGIGNQSSEMSQQAAGQAAQLKLMEQLQAQQQLQSMLGGTRGQDIGQSQFTTDALARAEQLKAGNFMDWQNAQLGGAERAGISNKLAAAGQAITGIAAMGKGAAAPTAPPVYGASSGGQVPGRPDVSGDSPVNDDVPTMLSPGEIVIPRSIAQHADAPSLAAAFVQAIRAERKSHPLMGGTQHFDIGGVVDAGPTPAQMDYINADETAQNQSPLQKLLMEADMNQARAASGNSMAYEAMRREPQDRFRPPTQAQDLAASQAASLLEPARLPSPMESAFNKGPIGGGAPSGAETPEAAASLRPRPPSLKAPGVANSSEQSVGRESAAPYIPGPDKKALAAYDTKAGASADAIGKDYDTQARATEEAAKQEAVFRKEQLDAQLDIDNHAKQLEATRQQVMGEKIAKLNSAVDELSNAKIDPSQFWASRTTGDKVLAGIGLALGALGSTNGVNSALGVINQAIDRDIDAQKANLSSKGRAIEMQQSALAAMRQNFGDGAAADAAAGIAARQRAINQIEAMKTSVMAPAEAAKLDAVKQGLQLGIAADQQKAHRQFDVDAATAAKDRGQQLIEMQRNAIMAAKTGKAANPASNAALETLARLRKKFAGLGKKATVSQLFGSSEAGKYDKESEASLMTLAAGITPGGRPPRNVEEAKARLKGLIPGSAGFKDSGLASFDALANAILDNSATPQGQESSGGGE